MHVRIKQEPPDTSDSASDTVTDRPFKDKQKKEMKSRAHIVSDSDSDSSDSSEHADIKPRPKKSPKSRVIIKSEPASDNEDKIKLEPESDSEDGIGRPQPAFQNPKKRKYKSSSKGLDDLVSCPSDFQTIKSAGILSTRDLVGSDNEFYLFRFPSGLINPDKLVGSKFSIGGKKSNTVTVKNKSYDVATYGSCSVDDTPTLFLPDPKGRLRQVDLNISGHIVFKENPAPLEQPQFNIDDFRLQPHVMPEIRPRSFFDSSGASVSKKSKLSKEERKLEKRKRSLDQSELMPPKKKKKSHSSLE